MAFAQIASERTGSQNSNATSHSVILPATVPAGALLRVAMAFDGNPTVTWDNSTAGTWTLLREGANGSVVKLTNYVKVADGTEAGKTLTITTSASEQSVYRAVAYTNWEGTLGGGVAVVTTPSTGTTANPDPPSLTTGWGSVDTTWIEVVAVDNGNRSVTAASANYTNLFSDASGGTAGVCLGSARRELAAATEDPGTMTISAADEWVAVTIAIRGAAVSNATGSYSSGWSLRNSQTGSRAGAWSVRNAATGSRAGDWSVRNGATGSRAGEWSVRNAASASQAGEWSVRNSAAGSQAGEWSVRNAATGDLAGDWTLANEAAGAYSADWSVLNAQTGELAGAWSVDGILSAAGGFDGAWSIAGASEATGGGWAYRRPRQRTLAEILAFLTDEPAPKKKRRKKAAPEFEFMDAALYEDVWPKGLTPRRLSKMLTPRKVQQARERFDMSAFPLLLEAIALMQEREDEEVLLLLH